MNHTKLLCISILADPVARQPREPLEIVEMPTKFLTGGDCVKPQEINNALSQLEVKCNAS